MPKIKIILKNVLFYPEYPKENNKISLKQFKYNFVSKFSGITPPPPPPIKILVANILIPVI
jgi:hypothetical protein